ncbi:MAG: ankyrin repeat domain-containing protein [Gammaproteobacteria bacterium WSBS_2016_MAG_OTU1]
MKSAVVALLTIILLAVVSSAFVAGLSLGDILLATLPLFVAAQNGDLSEVERLLGEGTDVDAKDSSWGDTILIWVIKFTSKNKIEMVKLLLSKVANVDAKNEYGMTALMVAASESSELVNLLLKNGADPDIKDMYGKNIWDLAQCDSKICVILNEVRKNKTVK